MVLVLYGDVPLVRATTLEPLVQIAREGGIGLLTVELTDPSGYGRIVRSSDGQVTGIVEDRDAKFAKTITLSYTFHETELPDELAMLDASGTGGNN